MNRKVLNRISKEESDEDSGKEARESGLEESDSERIERIRANLAYLKEQK